jgi:hypothetical protein
MAIEEQRNYKYMCKNAFEIRVSGKTVYKSWLFAETFSKLTPQTDMMDVRIFSI